MIVITLLVLIFLVVCLIASMYFIIEGIKINNNHGITKIEHFNTLMAVLVYHMDKAYAITYKDNILIYSVEGMRITEAQFDETVKKYAALVLKLIGSNLKEMYVSLYGDESTFLLNIMEYFNDKYEKDEIYQTSSDKIINADTPIIENGGSKIYSATDILTKNFNSYNNL